MLALSIMKFILGGLGIIALLPTIFLVPALIITAIIGAMKDNFTYLKKYLKIWGYSLLVFIGVLIVYAISSFVISSMIK
mgnify:CR=1